MSRPRKTCRESAEMTSAGIPSPRSAAATSIERPVLPVAVAPAMTRRGGAVRPSAMRSGRPAQGIRPGVLDDHAHERAEPALGAGQVHELVLARPAREMDGLGPLPWAIPAPDLRQAVGVVLVLVRPRGNDHVDEDLDRAAEPVA